MPRVKVAKKSIVTDMTAMCDVASLLLTFFIMTSNFTKKEPAQISTPTSISEIKIPETNVFLIMVDPKGKVFIGMDGQDKREQVLTKVGADYGLTFTPQELKEFSLLPNFGMPIKFMKTYLALSPIDRDKPEWNMGIPADSANNEFKHWIKAMREVNKEYRIAIKGDQATNYKVIKDLMNTLQDLRELRYNLITGLEQEPKN
jgi:biopolymer transport protein ExbD